MRKVTGLFISLAIASAPSVYAQVQTEEPTYKTQPMVERIPYCKPGWKLQQFDCGNMGACGRFAIYAQIPEQMGGWLDVPAGTGRGIAPGPHQGDYRCVKAEPKLADKK